MSGILVTGASGHVGANVLRAVLAQRGTEEVRALVRSTTDRRAFANVDVTFVEGDVRDLDAMRRAVKGCDRIYHCVAKVTTLQGEERELYDINVGGTRNILKAAKEDGVRRVVVTSSLGAVGHVPDRAVNEEDAFYPFVHHLPYEESKAWMEHECLKAFAEGVQVVMAVSTAVIGPHDYFPSRLGKVICDFANRELNAYVPGGFDFVGATDLAQGHLLAMEKGRPGQRYILTSEFSTLDNLMDVLERVTGSRRPRLRLPPTLMMGVAHVSTFFLRRLTPKAKLRFTPDAVRLLQMQRRADASKAKRELGFAPGSIETAVRAAYDWFVEHGRIRRPRAIPATATQPVLGTPAER